MMVINIFSRYAKLTNKINEKLALRFPQILMIYYQNNIQKLKENEKLIATDAQSSYYYASGNLNKRFELGEEAISKNANYSYKYARDVIKGRFELGEEAISKSAEYSYMYSVQILRGRFELGEEAIDNDKMYSYLYNDFNYITRPRRIKGRNG